MPSVLSDHRVNPLMSAPVDLPLAASMAAIELDCAYLERPIGFESTSHFVSLLEKTMVKSAVIEGIVYQSLSSSGWKPDIKTVSNALVEAPQLIEELKEAESADKEHLKKLRSFCEEVLEGINLARQPSPYAQINPSILVDGFA